VREAPRVDDVRLGIGAHPRAAIRVRRGAHGAEQADRGERVLPSLDPFIDLLRRSGRAGIDWLMTHGRILGGAVSAVAAMLVIIALANIALPLTNAFVGEFMMFNGLFKFNVWLTAVAGISIILAAVYTLNMVQKVFYGETNLLTAAIKEISLNEKIILSVVVVAIFLVGVYPQPMFELTKEVVTKIVGNK